jgi:hypothetical protein
MRYYRRCAESPTFDQRVECNLNSCKFKHLRHLYEGAPTPERPQCPADAGRLGRGLAESPRARRSPDRAGALPRSSTPPKRQGAWGDRGLPTHRNVPRDCRPDQRLGTRSPHPPRCSLGLVGPGLTSRRSPAGGCTSGTRTSAPPTACPPGSGCAPPPHRDALRTSRRATVGTPRSGPAWGGPPRDDDPSSPRAPPRPRPGSPHEPCARSRCTAARRSPGDSPNAAPW